MTLRTLSPLTLIISIGILGLAAVVLFVKINQQNVAVRPPQVPVLRTSSDLKDQGVTRVVPGDEIVSGGPPQDGIPSIDRPQFVGARDATFLSDDDVGIALSHDGDHRFYPFQILVWHEIVNDTIKGTRVLVTYCPLCSSGIVFDPVVNGERVEFGTSGKLWNSNLVMYDRKTHSLWSQILSQAIDGEMIGAHLTVYPSDIVRFGAWKKTYPAGSVLSRDTGFARRYGSDPYGTYGTSPGLHFPVTAKDSRLNEKEFVAGIQIGSAAKAYPVSQVRKQNHIADVLDGHTLEITYDDATEEIRVIEKTQNAEKQLAVIYAYWFSWFAAHPNTELYTNSLPSL